MMCSDEFSKGPKTSVAGGGEEIPQPDFPEVDINLGHL